MGLGLSLGLSLGSRGGASTAAWYTQGKADNTDPSFWADFENNRYAVNGSEEAFSDIFTFTRSTTGTRTNSSGLIETVAINQPRFDYDPVTLQPLGILIEEQRTNLLKHSENFTIAPWANTITGTSSRANSSTSFYPYAGLVSITSSNGGIRQSIGGLSAQAYSWSFYIESSNAATIDFKLENGNEAYGTFCVTTFNFTTGAFSVTSGFASVSSVALGSGWLVKLVLPTASGGFAANLEIRGGSGTIFKYAIPQFEAGSFPTSYIPTTTAAVTRAAETLSMPTGGWYNASEGTVSGEYTPTGVSAGSAAAQYYFFSASVNLDIVTSRVLPSGDMNFVCGDNTGVIVSNLYGASGLSLGTPISTAQAFKLNDFAFSVNGGSIASDTSGIMPLPTKLSIGSSTVGQRANGHIKEFRYYPIRVSNASLQELTT